MPPRKRPEPPSSDPPRNVNPRRPPPANPTAPPSPPAPAPAPEPAAAATVPMLTDKILKNLPEYERQIYKLVYAEGNKGKLLTDLRPAMGLSPNILNKHLAALVRHNILKEVHKAAQKRGHKIYMDARIEPSPEITGGTWYRDGKLDSEAVGLARRACLQQVDRLGAASADAILSGIKRENRSADYTIDQISDILCTMTLDRELEEVRGTGHMAGKLCYQRCSTSHGGMMEGIPCGVCPRIDECSPEGVISPTTCVYYKKWLQMDF